MSKTFKMIKLVGISDKSYEDAIQNAITEAGAHLKGLNWFEVVEQRGRISEDGKVDEWQVIIEVAFKILH
ncbi:MAG: dodecin [Leptospirales bacterium]